MHHSLRSDIHIKLVESWMKQNANGISLDKQAQLFARAIQSVERRTLMTLSNVTLMVILDRVLNESKEKFPLLSEVEIDLEGMSFEGLLNNTKNSKAGELVEALRYYLVELLSVLGRITADTLTTPLHKEVFKVIWESPKSSSLNGPEEK